MWRDGDDDVFGKKVVQPDSQLFTFGVAWVLCEAAGLAAGGLVGEAANQALEGESFSASAEALVGSYGNLDGRCT